MHFYILNINQVTPWTRFVKYPLLIARICSSEFFFYYFNMHDLILHLLKQVQGDSTDIKGGLAMEHDSPPWSTTYPREARLTPKVHSDKAGNIAFHFFYTSKFPFCPYYPFLFGNSRSILFLY